MKVYRFLSWTNIDHQGSRNELRNFEQLGLISPSYEYLWPKPKIANEGAHSFGDEKVMNKFFFLSLADALLVASRMAEINCIIEYDLPEEMLRNHIGLGYYGNLQVEFAIPYKELFEKTAVEQPFYTREAINFYNAHLYDPNIEQRDIYRKLESYLPYVSQNGIYHECRLKIYPLFCFKPNQAQALPYEQSLTNYYIDITEQIRNEREKRYNYQEALRNITRSGTYLEYYDQSYPRNKLFDFNYPIIEEENISLTRTLKRQ